MGQPGGGGLTHIDNSNIQDPINKNTTQILIKIITYGYKYFKDYQNNIDTITFMLQWPKKVSKEHQQTKTLYNAPLDPSVPWEYITKIEVHFFR